MQVKIFPDHEALSSAAADIIIQLIRIKPAALLCFASGETPRRTCELLVEKSINENVDFSKCSFAGLDEWVGIPPTNDGSCHYFFQHLVLDTLQPQNAFLFNAISGDMEGECAKMDQFILQHGPIDLMMVGIGMNGHIGFNEPGVSVGLRSHVIDLDPTTLAVGQKYFKKKAPIRQGITLGLSYLQQSGVVLLLANGEKKSTVIHEAVEGPVTPQFPASIIQTHANSIVMIDKPAASQLKNN